MCTEDRFQKIRDYVDSQNILDSLCSFLGDDMLEEFCEHLEDEYDITYDDEEYGDFD